MTESRPGRGPTWRRRAPRETSRTRTGAVGRHHWAPRSETGRRQIAGGFGGLVAAGLVLAACGGGGSAAPSTTARASATRSSASSTSTTDPATGAVLAAYRAASRAFQQALAAANPEDPALAATMVDPQLQGVKANLLADQRQGIVGRGTVTLHPKIASLSASTATVVDCAYSTSVLVYAKTGKPVPPVTPPENDGIRATLVLTGGSWKLARQTVTEGTCAPGS